MSLIISITGVIQLLTKLCLVYIRRKHLQTLR